MNESRLHEMITRRLDDDLDPEELRQLEELLRNDPEAAKIAREWEQIRAGMSQSARNTRIPDLSAEILKKIDMDMYKQPQPPSAIIAQQFWTRPFFRYSLAFVMGVFSGFLIFSYLNVDFLGLEPSASEISGTMYDGRSFDKMKVADLLQFNSTVVSTVCEVKYSPKVVEIRLDLSSPEQVKATLEFNFNALQVMNVQNVSVNDQSNSMSTGNYVQINNVGENKYVIQLYNKTSLPQQIDFRIYQNEVPAYQNSVQVNKE